MFIPVLNPVLWVTPRRGGEQWWFDSLWNQKSAREAVVAGPCALGLILSVEEELLIHPLHLWVTGSFL